ncbi:hypothetical protein TorRG33x02_041360 [Trema orientale]|uniref:Uncharacterized protein n=1 Tax=Trema orientale TaxID=63057 RepID=A0A2P5FQD7_TREOI|nr:hypothetical protein TorRG33x02_041360 [Trema orientale]
MSELAKPSLAGTTAAAATEAVRFEGRRGTLWLFCLLACLLPEVLREACSLCLLLLLLLPFPAPFFFCCCCYSPATIIRIHPSTSLAMTHCQTTSSASSHSKNSSGLKVLASCATFPKVSRLVVVFRAISLRRRCRSSIAALDSGDFLPKKNYGVVEDKQQITEELALAARVPDFLESVSDHVKIHMLSNRVDVLGCLLQ